VTRRAKRLLAWLFYRKLPVCFACGQPGERPCAGHEYGGTILQWRGRALSPWWVGRLVDCRWY
jgi:hypothetical protein